MTDDSGEKKDFIEKDSNHRNQTYNINLEQIISYQRSARNEIILRFLTLLLLSFTFGLVILQIVILWESRESYQMMELATRDRRLLSYPKFYQVPHNEETWCWDPETLLLKLTLEGELYRTNMDLLHMDSELCDLQNKTNLLS